MAFISVSDPAMTADVSPRSGTLPADRPLSSPTTDLPPTDRFCSWLRANHPGLFSSSDFRAGLADFYTGPALRNLRLTQAAYHLGLLTLTCVLLARLDSATPLLPPTAGYVILALIAFRSAVLLVLHISIPSTLSFYRHHRHLRLGLRVVAAAAVGVGAGLLDWGRLDDSYDEWVDLLLPIILAAELFVVVLQLMVLTMLTALLGWREVRPLAPFTEVGVEEERSGKVKAVMAEELKAIPPLRFHARLRCDKSCVICMADMVEGDEVRVLTCQHGFHATCLDEWLTWRQVCPLCVAGVRLPKQALREVEMTIRISTAGCE